MQAQQLCQENLHTFYALVNNCHCLWTWLHKTDELRLLHNAARVGQRCMQRSEKNVVERQKDQNIKHNAEQNKQKKQDTLTKDLERLSPTAPS